MGAVLGGAQGGWVVAILVAGLVSLYIRAERWRVLLRPLGDVPVYPVLSATAIGFGAGVVLPLRLGEIVRPALLSRHTEVGMTAALSSVVLERLFDMLLIIVCFLALSMVHEMPTEFRLGAYVLGAAAAAAFAALVFAQRNPARAESWLARLTARLPTGIADRVRLLGRSFLAGLNGLADTSTVLLVLGYSALVWGVIGLTFMFGFLALGIPVPLVAASLATVVIVAMAVFLPQAPGFLGTWQWGCVLALKIFKITPDVAFGYSLLTWMAALVTNVAIAGVFLAREDVSLGQLLRRGNGRDPAPGGG